MTTLGKDWLQYSIVTVTVYTLVPSRRKQEVAYSMFYSASKTSMASTQTSHGTFIVRVFNQYRITEYCIVQ